MASAINLIKAGWTLLDKARVAARDPCERAQHAYLPIARYEAERARKLLTQAVGWDVSVKAVLVILTGP
ncbi:MAG: hypothetical protein ACR2K2_03130 [Mycobacteriales bacterium]